MQASYFRFDRNLWEAGVCANCRFEDGALVACGPQAAYLSLPLDSESGATVWNRLRLRHGGPSGSVRFACAAADRADALDPFPRPAVESDRPDDLPLLAAQGRYLRFQLTFHPCDAAPIRISMLRIDFPLRSIADYLPELYRSSRDDSRFLLRLLALYQAPMEDLAEQIAAFPARLDADAAEGDDLLRLAAWAGVEEPSLWPAPKLKRLVKQSFRLCARKGTRAGLIDLLALYLGAPPLLVEIGALASACGTALYDRIYAPLLGSDRYCFYVLVAADRLEDRAEAARLQRIIDLYKPAHTCARLVLLERFTVLGGHSYLGVNSALSGNTTFALDGNAALPFHTALLK